MIILNLVHHQTKEKTRRSTCGCNQINRSQAVYLWLQTSGLASSEGDQKDGLTSQSVEILEERIVDRIVDAIRDGEVPSIASILSEFL